MVDPARLAEEAPDLADLGWDPLEDPLPWVDFARLVLRGASSSRPCSPTSR